MADTSPPDDWLGRDDDPSARTGGILPRWFHAPARPGGGSAPAAPAEGVPDMWPLDLPSPEGGEAPVAHAEPPARPAPEVSRNPLSPVREPSPRPEAAPSTTAVLDRPQAP